MNEHHDDPVLDVCLEEVLGGQQPPDLKLRILSAYERWQQETPTASPPDLRDAYVVVPPSAASNRAAAGIAQDEVQILPQSPSETAPPASSIWPGLAIGAGVLAGGALLGLLALAWTGPAPVQQSPLGVAADPERGSQSVSPPSGASPARPPSIAAATEDLPAAAQPTAVPPAVNVPDFGEPHPLEAIVQDDAPIYNRQTPQPAEQLVAELNRRFEEHWRTVGAEPAAATDDTKWCQRAFEIILGRPPRADELTAFLADTRTDKRRVWASCLSRAEEYRPEFARHWAARWARIFVPGEGEAARDYRVAVATFLAASWEAGPAAAEAETSLSEDAADPRGMSRLVQELLTAEGSAAAGDGAAGFLLAQAGRQGSRLAGHAARVLLGRRLDCAECHDHPADPQLPQYAFWEWKAFFRDVQIDWSEKTAPRLLAARAPRQRKTLFFETPAGELKAAYPSFPGHPRGHLGVAAGSAGREELAQLLAGSEAFAAAIANRTWSMIFGFGLANPVDDMGPHNRPAQEQVLRLLAGQFAWHGHAFPELVSWIAASDVFGLQTLSSLESSDHPELGQVPTFSRFYGPLARRPLPQLLAGLGSEAKPAASSSTTARLAPVGPPKGDELRPTPSLPADWTQLQPSRAMHAGPPPLVESILAAEMDQQQKLTHLFAALLQRPPGARERRLVTQLLDDAEGTRLRELWLDVWWALECSEEARR